MVDEDQGKEHEEKRRHFFESLTINRRGEEFHRFDPHGGKKNVKNGERGIEKDAEFREGSLEERAERFFFRAVIEIFEKDEADEEDEDDIGDIFGKEGEAEEDAGKDEVAEEALIEEEEVGEDRKRGEDPEECIGIDDFRYADEDR